MNKIKKREVKRLSGEAKEELLRRFKNKEPLRKISKELKISYLTIWNYYQKFKSGLSKSGESIPKEEILKRLDKIEALLNGIYQGINQSLKTGIEEVKTDIYQDINQEKKDYQISKNLNDYVSLEEASKILGVTYKSASRYISRGLLKKVSRTQLGLYGRGIMILKKSIEDLQKQKRI